MFEAAQSYGTGEYGHQVSPDGKAGRRLPHNAPAVAPKLLVGPDDTLVQNYVPLGVRLDAPLDQISTFEVTLVQQGLMYFSGVRSFNEVGQVMVERLVIGNGLDISRSATPFDAATFRTTRCFCPVDWGCGDTMTIALRGLVPAARLNWAIFGTLQQSFNACYPSAGTLEEQAAALWGMENGRDPNDRGTLAAWKASRRAANRSRSGAAKWLATRLLAMTEGR